MLLEELQNGRYRHLRILGSGGMGEVYLMEDTRVSRKVAIKVTRTENSLYFDYERNQEVARLFQREAKAIATLEHPNILPLYDFGDEVHDGTTITYMVMPFCAKGSLANWLKQQDNAARLSPQDIAHLVEQAADALQYAHEQHIVHLDVKPSNFLLRGNKKNPMRPILLLADFGIARSVTTVSSASRTIRGTPTSMAPEQWGGAPTPATDQYALAVMTYEMLVGRPPFVGTMEQLMYRHFTADAPAPSRFNPQLSPALDAVLLRALLKKPEERFDSITDFAGAFAEATKDLPATPVLATAQPVIADEEREIPSFNHASGEVGVEQIMTILQDDEQTRLAHAGKKRADGVATVPENAQQAEPVEAAILAGRGEKAPEAEISEPTRIAPSPRKRRSGSPEADQPLAPVAAEDQKLISEGAVVLADEVMPEAHLLSEQEQPREQVVNSITEIDPFFAEAVEPQSPIVSVVALHGRLPVVGHSSLRRVLSLVLLFCVLLLLAGGVVYSLSLHRPGNHLGSTGALQSSQTAVTRSTLTPAETPTLTPTLSPGLAIAGTYHGSLADQTTYQTEEISLHIIQAGNTSILNGSVTFTSLQTTYTLTGTINMQGNFSFTLQQSPDQVPLTFSGNAYQQGGRLYLKGNFCNAGANACSSAKGYFNVGPQE